MTLTPDAPILRNGHDFVGRPDGGGRFVSTPKQLQDAAIRLAHKTRFAPADNDRIDPATDAALVASAYLDLTREDPRLQVMEPSIQTISGEYFDFRHPEKFSWDVEVIAHGLAHQCRFTGHARWFYSIAQHSVCASYIAPPGFEFEALLHDAHEALYGDMATPLKILCPDYRRLEQQGESAMRAHFGLPPTISPEVKAVDLRMLATEKRDVMPEGGPNWGILDGVSPAAPHIQRLTPEEARQAFIYRFDELSRLQRAPR